MAQGLRILLSRHYPSEIGSSQVWGSMGQKRCPYFEDVPVKSCDAVLEGIKVPTEGEVKRFCAGGYYERCPTFINRIRKEKEVLEGKLGYGGIKES